LTAPWLRSSFELRGGDKRGFFVNDPRGSGENYAG
jgi:hypothetical protein